MKTKQRKHKWFGGGFWGGVLAARRAGNPGPGGAGNPARRAGNPGPRRSRASGPSPFFSLPPFFPLFLPLLHPSLFPLFPPFFSLFKASNPRRSRILFEGARFEPFSTNFQVKISLNNYLRLKSPSKTGPKLQNCDPPNFEGFPNTTPCVSHDFLAT